jgi:hypothetical protein
MQHSAGFELKRRAVSTLKDKPFFAKSKLMTAMQEKKLKDDNNVSA